MTNAVAFESADGFKVVYPLRWLRERGAILVTKLGERPIRESVGGANQLWIPGAAARLFVRDVVKVEFLDLPEEPEVPSEEKGRMLFRNRPNISIGIEGEKEMGYAMSGTSIPLEGWAYDYGRRIDGVELSFDGGVTWLELATPDTDPDRWVRWTFLWEAPAPGQYKVLARAVAQDGTKSPTPDSCDVAVI